MERDKIKIITAIHEFSVRELSIIEKEERVKIAKQMLSRNIGNLIYKEFEDMPLEFEVTNIMRSNGNEEYRAMVYLVDFEYLKELKRKARVYDEQGWVSLKR